MFTVEGVGSKVGGRISGDSFICGVTPTIWRERLMSAKTKNCCAALGRMKKLALV
jgi:hypothetical protein